MNDLVIVGNGFDIAHGIPCRYKDFHEYLVSNPEKESIADALDFIFPHTKKCDIWMDFEESLAYPSKTNVNEFADIDGNINYLDLKKVIQDGFVDWVHSLSGFYGELSKNCAYIDFIKKDNYFISFNYTSTLEDIYLIYKVCHLHGQASFKGEDINDEIIFGHAPKRRATKLVKETEKPVNEVIEKKYKELRRFSTETNGRIVLIGFSYSEVDFPYIKLISFLNPKKKWIFFYHSKADFSRLQKYINSLKLKKSQYTIRESYYAG